MDLLIVGGLKESAQHRTDPLPGPEPVGVSGQQRGRHPSRPQADERGLRRVPSQAKADLVGCQVGGIGISPYPAVHVASIHGRKVGGYGARGQHSLDHRPVRIFRLPGLDKAGAVGRHVEERDHHVGGRVGLPEIAHDQIADVLAEGGLQRLVRITIPGQRKEEGTPRFREDRGAQLQVERVHLGSGHPRRQPRRDDGTRGGPRRQAEDVWNLHTQMLLQHRKSFGHHHPLDPAPIDRQRHMLT